MYEVERSDWLLAPWWVPLYLGGLSIKAGGPSIKSAISDCRGWKKGIGWCPRITGNIAKVDSMAEGPSSDRMSISRRLSPISR